MFNWLLFQNDIETAAANVLDIFAMIDPTKMVEKQKLHLLAHLREDIIRFGPLVGVSTEAFECFNAIFRFCSIYSNHLAPSRDISRQLASQESLKHRVTGGWWRLDPKKNAWTQAGPLVRDFLHLQPMLQGLLGWHNPKPLTKGWSFLYFISIHISEYIFTCRRSQAPSNEKDSRQAGS